MKDPAMRETTPVEPIFGRHSYWGASIGLLVLVGLFVVSRYSFLLFHSLAELFSIVIGVGFFVVAWNSRDFLRNNYLLFLGVAYLFVSGLDLVHTLAYKGMGVFLGYDANLPTQLWIAARYMESLSLLLAPFFIGRRLRLNLVFGTFLMISGAILLSLFYWKVFPDCFVEGVGLTRFKIASEYVISATLLGSLALLWRFRARFERRVFALLASSVIFTVFSELFFTFYVSVYGLSNLIGHYFKIVSFYFMYKAVVETGLRQPYALLVKELKAERDSSQRERDRLSKVLQSISDGFFTLDDNFTVTYFNRAAELALGRKSEEVLGRNLFEEFPKAKGSIFEAEFTRGIRAKVPISFETCFGAKPYENWYDVRVYPQEEGISVYFLVTTDKKRAEEALRESERRFRALVEGAPFGMVHINEDGTYEYLNPRFRELFGYDLSAIPHGREWFRKAYPDPTYRHEAISAWVSDVARTDKSEFPARVFAVRSEDGTEKVISFRLVRLPLGQNLITCEDITEMKRAEQALRESEERYRTLMAISPDAVLVYVEGRCVYANDAAARLFGLNSSNTLVGKGPLDVAHPDSWEAIKARMRVLTEDEKHVPLAEEKFVRADGTIVHGETAATPAVLQGKPAILVVIRDITERRRAEEALRKSEEFNRRLVDSAPVGIVYLTNDGTIEYINPAANRIAGIQESQVSPGLGRNILELPGLQDRPDIREGFRRLMTGQSLLDLEVPYPSSMGRETVLLVAATPRLGADGTVAGAILMFSDISELKRAEELQRTAARLRAVADLAGGVAHNFNNLLQIVIGHLELALLDLESGNYPYVKDALEKVLNSSRLGAETVRRLQSFAGIRDHSRLSEEDVFDLSDIVRQAVEMSQTWWKSIPEKEGIKVSLHTDLQDGGVVQGEKNELFEVVVNLLKNASEALPRGGAIQVTTVVEGNHVVLKVRDTGIGINKENFERLFNPFFTTKANIGSGLGLASSRKTIEGCGGEILVESSEGKGTTFTIRLPLAKKPPKQAPPPAPHVSGPGKTVLVIDDMEGVLDVLKAGLTRSGHVVVTASSGLQGLDIFRETPIDLVICDLGMPGINGWEVGKRIRSLCRERHTSKTPFILLTGWSSQKTEAEKVAESGVDAIVEKPINIGNILKIIHEIGEKETSQGSQRGEE